MAISAVVAIVAIVAGVASNQQQKKAARAQRAAQEKQDRLAKAQAEQQRIDARRKARRERAAALAAGTGMEGGMGSSVLGGAGGVMTVEGGTESSFTTGFKAAEGISRDYSKAAHHLEVASNWQTVGQVASIVGGAFAGGGVTSGAATTGANSNVGMRTGGANQNASSTGNRRYESTAFGGIVY